MITYDEARSSIKSGDIVFFRATKTSQKVITFFTGGQHSHCGIAMWMTGESEERRLMLIESFVGGCRIINLRSYSERPMNVLDIGLDWKASEEYAIAKTGKVSYGGIDFLAIGLKDVLTKLHLENQAKRINNNAGEVCSEMVADVLMQSNLRNILAFESSLISPSTLYQTLVTSDCIRKHLTIDVAK